MAPETDRMLACCSHSRCEETKIRWKDADINASVVIHSPGLVFFLEFRALELSPPAWSPPSLLFPHSFAAFQRLFPEFGSVSAVWSSSV